MRIFRVYKKIKMCKFKLHDNKVNQKLKIFRAQTQK